MQDDEGWEGAVTTLAKAQKAIDLGLACQPEPEEETELTVLCLGHTATDVHQVRSTRPARQAGRQNRNTEIGAGAPAPRVFKRPLPTICGRRYTGARCR